MLKAVLKPVVPKFKRFNSGKISKFSMDANKNNVDRQNQKD